MSLDSQLIHLQAMNKEPNSYSSTRFRVRFPGRGQQFQAVTLKHLMFPNTVYNVVSGLNDEVTIRNPAGPTNYIATLTPGNYGLTNFVAHLQSRMNSAWSNSFVVSVSETTQRMTITGTAAFILNWSNSTNNAALIMGWAPTTDTSSATSQTAPYAYDLSGPQYLFLDLNFATKKVINSAGYSSTFIIPMDSNSGAFAIVSESSTFVATSIAESFQTTDMVEVAFYAQYNSATGGRYQLVDNGGAEIGMILELQSIRK